MRSGYGDGPAGGHHMIANNSAEPPSVKPEGDESG